MGWNKPFITGSTLMIVWGWFLRMWIIPLPIHWVFDHRQNSGLEVPTKKYLFNSGITQLYLQKINCCQGSTHPRRRRFFLENLLGAPGDTPAIQPFLAQVCQGPALIAGGSNRGLKGYPTVIQNDHCLSCKMHPKVSKKIRVWALSVISAHFRF